jgi:hypothetical protein
MRNANQEILALEEESMMLKDAIDNDQWADEFQIMRWRDRIFEIEIEQENLKKSLDIQE